MGLEAEVGVIAPGKRIGVENGGAGRGLGDRVRDRLRAQLDTSFQMLRHARDRGISVMSGSDTGNASAFSHGRWHGKEAELFVKEVGMPPMEAIVANTHYRQQFASRPCSLLAGTPRRSTGETPSGSILR